MRTILFMLLSLLLVFYYFVRLRMFSCIVIILSFILEIIVEIRTLMFTLPIFVFQLVLIRRIKLSYFPTSKRVYNWSCFTNEEYADMHFAFGFYDDNSRRSEKKCHMSNSHRQVTNSVVFIALHQTFKDNYSFRKVCERIHDCLPLLRHMYSTE